MKKILITETIPEPQDKCIISGGKHALTKLIEGAEDLKNINVKEIVKNSIKPSDIVIGLVASGATKFTVNIIKYANEIGALTIGISNKINSSNSYLFVLSCAS